MQDFKREDKQMNYVALLGRLVKDVNFRYSQQGTAVAQITLAVDRFANGEKKADFIPVILFGKQAEVLANGGTAKGHRLLVEGSISTRSYEAKDGSKRFVTEVIAQRMEFIEKKSTNASVGNSASESGMPDKADFGTMGQAVPFDEEIPF